MKKLFRFLAATALVAFAAACGQDGADPYNPTSGDTDVTFSVAAPGGVASRAVADGLKATELQWAIYLTGDLEKADMAPVQQGTATFVNRETEVKVRLVAGKSYDIIFWAQDPDCTDYAIDWMTKKLSITYNDVEEGNNDDRDAFLWVERNLKVNGAIEKDIWLYRPFAQLNVGISYADINVALQHKYELAGTKVKASTYTQFDFTAVGTDKEGNYLPGKPVGEMKEITFDWAAPVSKNQTTDVEKLKLNDGSEYFWASFNYLLADTPASTTDVAIWFNYTTDSKEEPIGPFTWVPIERNHRTNIVGDLLTDPATFKVYIDNEFDEPAHELTPWNGKLEPLPVAGADGYINIETPGQMATLLANASGLKAKLAEDLDMAGYTVAVNPELTRNLELDGQGHMVKNLVVESGAKVNGLFPSLVSSTVKNLVIDGIVVMPAAARATIEGDYYAGGLAGATYGTVNVEKVTVKGAKVAGVNKVGGLVGFVAENVLNVDGAVVEASEVSTLSEADGGCVGGLIGYVTPNATVKNSTVKNTKIVAINSAGAAKRANSEFIGAYHGSKGTTLAIEKAVIEGNTFAETANGYVAPDYFLGLVGGNRNGEGLVTIDGKEATDAVPSPWCLIGVNGEWTKDVPMVVAENGMAVAYGIELKEGGFKVRIPNDDGSWNDAANYGVDSSVAGAKVYANMPIPVFTSGGSSNIVPVVYATYDIYFDEANKVVYLMEAGKPVSEAVEFEKFREKLNLAEGNTWGIVGTFSDWGEDFATMEIGEIDGELWAVAKNLKITAADEFKFRANGQWSLNYGGPQKMEIGKLYEGIINSGDNMSVAADGYYNLYFSMDYATIKIEAGDAPVITPEIVKVSVESLEFAAEGGEQTIEIELVGEAELQITTPEWVSINAAENVLTVSVAANETTEVIEGVIVLTYGESTVEIPVMQAAAEKPAEPTKVTIADFLAAEVDDTTIYELTGTITEIKNTTYGNFYMEDESSSVYVYGLKDAEGNNIDWAAMGLNVNDVITIQGLRSDYQGTAQVGGAIYISHVDQEAPAVTLKQATVAEFLAAEVGDGITYELTGKVTGVYNTTYGNFYLEDATGTVQIYGVVDEKGTQKIWSSLGVVEGDIITLQGARGEYGGNPQMSNGVYIKHEAGEPAIMGVDPESISFASAGGSKDVTVSTYGEGAVTASDDADWVEVVVAGNVVTVTAAANEGEAREAVVTISFAGDSKTVAISQAAKPAEGGSEPVTVSLTMADLGYANQTSVKDQEIKVDDNVTLVFKPGSAGTPPTYYTSGEAIRMYQNGATLDVTANGKTITAVKFTFASNMNYLIADSGTMSNGNADWTGEATAVKFTCNGTTSKTRAYIAAIEVTYQ
ncbi:MAG: hypothetical protein IKM37_01780 [Alistipes sp.]|nr:hypothetical protein [Alistipes sp.]